VAHVSHLKQGYTKVPKCLALKETIKQDCQAPESAAPSETTSQSETCGQPLDHLQPPGQSDLTVEQLATTAALQKAIGARLIALRWGEACCLRSGWTDVSTEPLFMNFQPVGKGTVPALDTDEAFLVVGSVINSRRTLGCGAFYLERGKYFRLIPGCILANTFHVTGRRCGEVRP
jgi:hypothetical protein